MTVTPSQQATLLLRARRRRHAGKVVAPVVNADTLRPFPVTFPYGVPTSHSQLGRHTGEDHACPIGSLALATTWGTVVFVTGRTGSTIASWGSAYGVHVVIRTHSGRFDYAHCHLSQPNVTPGQKVQPGQVIGYTGATGNVTGPHDHLEARPAGGRFGSDINPRAVKRRRAATLQGAHP